MRRRLEAKTKDKVMTTAPKEVLEIADTSVQADLNVNNEQEMGLVRKTMAHILDLLALTGFQDYADYDSREYDDNKSNYSVSLIMTV